MTVPSRTQYLSLVGNIGEEIAKALDPYHGDRDTLAFTLNLVLTEAVTNAIKYARPHSSNHPIRIKILFHRNELFVRVYDHGRGFDLDAVQDPDLDQPSEGGLGIFLIRAFMDSVDYRKIEEGNILEMRKKLA
jgi:serine/threonine-protein kinase RsbW